MSSGLAGGGGGGVNLDEFPSSSACEVPELVPY